MAKGKSAKKRVALPRHPVIAKSKRAARPAAPGKPPSLASRELPVELVEDGHSSPTFAIAGIGASAGGLEALGKLLKSLPKDPCVALVIVQHMDPRHESVLAHLLAETTELPVLEVAHEMVVAANHIYVVPPNREMGIRNGRLQLMPRPNNRTQFNPIDYFFHTLAEYAQSKAIGVVLSGTASDGAIGLREIAEAGGIVISQDPTSAKFDGMPRAAIATGVVDLILPPERIAQELGRIGTQLNGTAGQCETEVIALDPSPGAEAAPGHLARIFTLLRKASGVDFSHYKQPTIRRRLHRRMVLNKIQGIDAYIRLLEQTPTEVMQLYQDILIHVTRFFREPESFTALEAVVYPEIVKTVKTGNPIRVWVPGCSTGEEAYSVAISLLEYLGDEAPGIPIQVFGTDVSEVTIEQARTGVYPESISADVSPERLRHYFTRADGHFRINRNVRDLCIFARQDVTRDPPFSKLDLIVCRNVLIYLNSTLQKKLMQVFHYAMRPNGFLMLGGAETIGFNSDLFSIAEKKHKIYTKNAITAGHRDVDFMLADPPSRMDQRATSQNLLKAANSVQNEANRIILSRYSPAGVIVDSDMRIVHFRGQTGDFLEPAPGEASLSLLKMAREGLLHGLRTAIHEGQKSDSPVRKDGLRVKIGGRMHDVAVEVIPIASAEGRHFLILFHDYSDDAANAPAEAVERPSRERGAKTKSGAGTNSRTEQRFLRLQQEVAASREYLQSIIQDMEAANEELQSANEEILSSNEELQSTNEELDTAKEELQSTNEELNTVNDELQGRNEELSRVNSDLINLLGSVQIAIVMVAGDLRIRRFTPMAEKVLNLIPGDVGRPISDIKPNINCPNLENLITEAVDGMTIKECEAQDGLGNWYLVRIRPYKNVENRIDGAVIALFDLHTNRRPGAGSAAAIDAIGTLAEAHAEPTLVLDAAQVVRAANRAFVKTMDAGEVIGRPVGDLGRGRWDDEELTRVISELPARDALGGQAVQDGKKPPRDDEDASIRARRQLIDGEPVTVVVFNRPKTLPEPAGRVVRP